MSDTHIQQLAALRAAAAQIDIAAANLTRRAEAYASPIAKRLCVEDAEEFRDRAAQIRGWADEAEHSGVTPDMEAGTREAVRYARVRAWLIPLRAWLAWLGVADGRASNE